MTINNSHMCCSRFAESLCNRKKRGMAIIPFFAPKIELFFQLSFRATNAEDSNHVVGTGAVEVQTRYSVGIRHCPWCGVDLKTFYSHSMDELPIIVITNDADFVPNKLFALVDESNCVGPSTLENPSEGQTNPEE